jgi:hypothetical protein
MIHCDFNLFEMRQHTPSGKIFVPLQNFMFPIYNTINGNLTVVLTITKTNIKTNFFVDIIVTDVINRLSVAISPILTDTEILVGLCKRTNMHVSSSTYSAYTNTAIDFAVDNLICKIASKESNNTNKIIKLKRLIMEYQNNHELTNSKCKLDDLLVEEAQHRFLSYKVKIIQEQFKKSISNPSYKMCRSRLLREYSEFP